MEIISLISDLVKENLHQPMQIPRFALVNYTSRVLSLFYPAQDSGDSEERAKFSMNGLLTAKSDICDSVTVPTAEFHLVVKSGICTYSRISVTRISRNRILHKYVYPLRRFFQGTLLVFDKHADIV